jgi:ligand-binding sensor domain-containing protein
MKLISFLFISLLATGFTSCNGQSTPQDQHLTIGGKVTALAKGYRCIYQDKQNNYWFGSEAEGVYRYSNKTLTRFTKNDGLCDDRVRDIQEDKQGNIYFTTENGISKFDGMAFTTLQVVADNDPDNWTAGPDDLWFRGELRTHGPRRYDGKNLYSFRFPKDEMEDDYYKQFPGTSIDPYDLYTIYKDRKGNIWFGTGSLGVYQYDGKTVRHLYEDHLTNAPNGGSFGIRSIFEDRQGKFWICNTKYRYNILPGDSKELGKGYLNYTRETGIENISNGNLGGDRIYFQSIAQDTKGDLWMQTYQGGIWRYDGKTITNYPVKQGTEDVKVLTMYQDRQGGLWLATQERGIYKFDGTEFKPFQP